MFTFSATTKTAFSAYALGVRFAERDRDEADERISLSPIGITKTGG